MDRIRQLEADNKQLRSQNERLQTTNSTLSAELARNRSATKLSVGLGSPYIKIPKK
jgi:predicted RNase H-like nuclease (RuvC/YqgF family)